MNTALLKVSLDVIAVHFFGEAVKIKVACLDTDDLRHGTITLLIEGDGLPAEPALGEKYAFVRANFTTHHDEQNLVPAERVTVAFERVMP